MRVLMLTHRLPYAPNKGDRLRAYNMLKVLAASAQVDLISLAHSAEEASHAGDLADLASSVAVARTSRLRNLFSAVRALPARQPLTHALLDASRLQRLIHVAVAAHPPDVVLAYCSGMARFAIEPLLQPFPLVLDMVDVDSLKWLELARRTPPPKRWLFAREACLLSRFEARAARAAAATLVVNERERDGLAVFAPDARIVVLKNGVDLGGFAPKDPPSADPNVVFCGVFSYRPNEEAALWFARYVWPIVTRTRPDARLWLVGADPTRAVRNLAKKDASITVTGTVPDVRPFLWKASVAVAPLLTARGVQNKVLEATAAGLPVVTTPAVMDGLPQDVVPACRVAVSPAGFAQQVEDLLACTPEARREIAGHASLVDLSWRARMAPLLPILQLAAHGIAPRERGMVAVEARQGEPLRTAPASSRPS